MIKTVTVTNYLGDSIKLELARPELTGFAITRIDGLEPAETNINMTEVAGNDGAIYNSARANMRNIVMYLLFTGNNLGESIEDLRHKTYKYFPTKKKLKLQIETDNRISEIEGYVETNNVDIFSSKAGTQISIVCPYPYFYSSDRENVASFSNIEAAFEFPFSNESLTESLIELGRVEIGVEKVVQYDGDAEVGMTISIFATGEAGNITIYNVRTREQMILDVSRLEALTGSGIISGDEITINTVKGDKWVTLLRNGITYNILNCLSRDADWFSLSKGDNIFSYTAEFGGSNLQFVIKNRIIYEGV